MRKYITEHRTEFVPDGEGEPAVEETIAEIANQGAPSTNGQALLPEDKTMERLKDTERRGLQWALDTITGVSKVARESFWGAIDVLGDLAESAPAGNVWLWLVLFLLVSNMWTLLSLRQANKREDMTRRRAATGRGYGSVGRGAEERESEIAAEAVRAFLEGITKPHNGGSGSFEGTNLGEEVARLQKSLDAIEIQVERLRGRLHLKGAVEEPLNRMD